MSNISTAGNSRQQAGAGIARPSIREGRAVCGGSASKDESGCHRTRYGGTEQQAASVLVNTNHRGR